MTRVPIKEPLETSVLVEREGGWATFPLAEVMTLGRLGYGYQGVPIHLNDPMASAGRHTLLRRTPAGLMADHLGSTNKTRLNDVEFSGSVLVHVGDELTVGRTRVRFEHTLAGPAWHPPVEAQGLLEAVYRAPDDRHARSVLSDVLVAHGDARGEFMACQLADSEAARSRSAALFATHWVEWLAPLPVPVERWAFSFGFMAEAWLRDASQASALLAVHRLAQVRTLTLAG